MWLWSLVSMETRQAWYGTDLDSFFRKLKEVKAKMCFAHNLRFDGSMIMWWCLKHNVPTEQIIDGNAKAWYQMRAMGVEFRDSLKKFPMSLASLAYALGIPGKTEKPDFTRYIPPGYTPTWDEIRYCIQDSNIVAEAIAQEYAAGRMRLTASSEAYFHLRQTIPNFNRVYPALSMYEDSLVRPAYSGGVSFLADRFAGEELYDVYVYDINSSYPAQLAGVGGVDGKGGQRMPYGYGWIGEEPRRDQVYIVKFTTEFNLKKDHIPSILSTRNLRYAAKADNFIRDSDGPTELTMTSVDYELFHQQYDIDYEDDHEFVCYESAVGMCADFINENNKLKEMAPKNSYERQKYKLNNNMAYGSFGINPNAWRVTPTLTDNVIDYEITPEQRKARYSPIAAFATAYGRKQLITAFQANYRYAVYTDTDSIHMLKPAKNLCLHDKHLGMWKRECWKDLECYPTAKYLRPKCYCHADENHKIFKEKLPDGRWDIELKCAGVPDEAKLTLDWNTFNEGHVVTGKLQQCLVPGGACLMPTTYTI